MKSLFAKIFVAPLAALVILAALSAPAFANDWVGIWSVKDTEGKPFFIAVFPDGKAVSTLENGITGIWKAEGGTAEIKWHSGWRARLFHDGSKTMKDAYRPGQSFGDKPLTTSLATKVDDGD